MTTKEYLSQAFTIDRILKAKQAQLEELKERRFFIGGLTDGDRVQSSPRSDKTGEISAIYLDLMDEYIRDIKRLIQLKTEIKGFIGTLANPTHRLIMEERYINLKRWEDIAVDNNFSWRAVHKIHNKALVILKECIEVH